MYYYKLYNLNIRSEIFFPQLVKIENHDEFDAEILLGQVQKDIIHSAIEEGKPYEYSPMLMWFKNHKGIFVIENKTRIYVQPFEGVPIEETHAFILGYCIAQLFVQRELLAIHGSAISLGEQAVIISGQSGAGKSTLTSRFLQEGCGFLTDDLAIVEKVDKNVMINPAYPQQKLCRDAAINFAYDLNSLIYIDEDRDKYAVALEQNFTDHALPLKGIFILEKAEVGEPFVEEIIGINKLDILFRNLYLEPVFRMVGCPSAQMKKCLEIASQIPLYILKRPTEGDSTLDQIMQIKDKLFVKK